MYDFRLIIAALCFLTPLFSRPEQVSYVSVEVPDAVGTYPMTINNSMTVAGYYLVSPTEAHGFVRSADGSITTFIVPGSLWTEPESINDKGDIAGFYELADGAPRGFERLADGRVEISESAGPPDGPEAQPIGITAFNVIAGNYPQSATTFAGFTRFPEGNFSTFAYGEEADYPTVVTGLNRSGTVVGYVSHGGGAESAFYRHPDGISLQFSVPVPGENSRDFNFATVADAINAAGTITGWYINCENACGYTVTGGFVRSPQGEYTFFSPPGTLLTVPQPGLIADTRSLAAPHWLSINTNGSIAGSYIDADQVQHGFVRCPTSGEITSFDPPNGKMTTVTAISDAGAIAGTTYYQSAPNVAAGFLRVPVTQPATP
jgi:uncharacterized membrane protein